MEKPGEACLSEASRTIMEVQWGVTINISPYKTVDGTRWNRYTYDQQCAFLKDLWCNTQYEIFDDFSKVTNDYVFEKTKKGNAHLHGYIDCSCGAIKSIQDSIHEMYGYVKDPPERIFNYSRTLVHRRFWIRYMNKELLLPNYIPEKPMVGLFG